MASKKSPRPTVAELQKELQAAQERIQALENRIALLELLGQQPSRAPYVPPYTPSPYDVWPSPYVPPPWASPLPRKYDGVDITFSAGANA